MLLMRLLSSHPEVLSYKPHRFEQRIAGYWIEALLALSEPASYLRGITPQTVAPAGRRGPDVVARDRCPDAVAAARRGGAGVARRRGGGGTRRDLPAADRRGLRDHRHRDRRHDASLSSPRSRACVSPSLAAELYPNGRELFLVRDFRDMVCSMLAFNEKRGVSGFGRAEADSDMEFVETLGGQATSLARAWERRRDRAHLVRYEDLVLDPERALAGLLDHVGVDSGTGHRSRACWTARGGHTRAARSRDQRLRTGARSAAGARTSTPSWPRPASGLSAPRWSCSATSGDRNEPARAARDTSHVTFTRCRN